MDFRAAEIVQAGHDDTFDRPDAVNQWTARITGLDRYTYTDIDPDHPGGR